MVPRPDKKIIYLFLILGVLFSLPLYAFRSSGGGSVENDGNVQVTLKLEEADGSFRWESLPEHSSLNLPEGTARISIHRNRLARDVENPRVRVFVWHPSGERVTLQEYGAKIDLIPDGSKKEIFPDPRSGGGRSGAVYDERN